VLFTSHYAQKTIGFCSRKLSGVRN